MVETPRVGQSVGHSSPEKRRQLQQLDLFYNGWMRRVADCKGISAGCHSFLSRPFSRLDLITS